MSNEKKWMQPSDVVGFAIAESSKKTYDAMWKQWCEICEANEVDPMSATPDEVAAMLVQMADMIRPRTTSEDSKLSINSLELIVAAINRQYMEADIPSPTSSNSVKRVMQGLRRIKSGKTRQVMALSDRHMKLMLDTIEAQAGTGSSRQLACYRDASLISMGFSGAMRISEITTLRVEDVAIFGGFPKRCVVTIPKSKTDQTGTGQRIPVLDGNQITPITRLEKWLQVSGINSGYIYRAVGNNNMENRPIDTGSVRRVIKKWAEKSGLPAEEISGHSLRAGFVTSAAQSRAPLHKIMEITRHKNPATVMGYIRDADMFSDHAGVDFL